MREKEPVLKMLAHDEVIAGFIHPFSLTLCGPSQAGKSTLCEQIIARRDEVIQNGPIKHVVYVIGQGQPEFIEFKKKHPIVEFINEWDETYLRPETLLIFDDFGDQFSGKLNSFITGKINCDVGI